MLLLGIIAALSLFSFYLFPRNEDRLFFLVGAVMATAGELIAVRYGAWKYGVPQMFGIPIYLPLLWGLSAMYSRRIINNLVPLRSSDKGVGFLKSRMVHKSGVKFLYDVISYSLVIVVVANLWKNNALVALLLFLIFLIHFLRFHTLNDISWILFSIVGGVLIDNIFAQTGVWTYANPSFFGSPIWVIPAYATFSLLVLRTALIEDVLLSSS